MKTTILMIFGLLISILSFSEKDSEFTRIPKEKFCIEDGEAPITVSIDNSVVDKNKLVLFSSYRLPTEFDRELAKGQLHKVQNGDGNKLVLFNSYRLPTEFERKNVKGQLHQLQSGDGNKLILFNSYRLPTEFEKQNAQPKCMIKLDL